MNIGQFKENYEFVCTDHYLHIFRHRHLGHLVVTKGTLNGTALTRGYILTNNNGVPKVYTKIDSAFDNHEQPFCWKELSKYKFDPGTIIYRLGNYYLVTDTYHGEYEIIQLKSKLGGYVNIPFKAKENDAIIINGYAVFDLNN